MKLLLILASISLVGCGTALQKQVVDKPLPAGAYGVSYNCEQTQQDMNTVSSTVSISNDTKWALVDLGFFTNSQHGLPGVYEINKIIYTIDCKGTSKLGRSILRWKRAELDEITAISIQHKEAKRKATVDERTARLKKAGML